MAATEGVGQGNCRGWRPWELGCSSFTGAMEKFLRAGEKGSLLPDAAEKGKAPCALLCGRRSTGRGGRLEHWEGRSAMEPLPLRWRAAAVWEGCCAREKKTGRRENGG